MASALALQCSTIWAMKTHTFGAGQFVPHLSAHMQPLSLHLPLLFSTIIFPYPLTSSCSSCEIFYVSLYFQHLVQGDCAINEGALSYDELSSKRFSTSHLSQGWGGGGTNHKIENIQRGLYSQIIASIPVFSPLRMAWSAWLAVTRQYLVWQWLCQDSMRWV